ncbi:tetraspanin-19 [Epinephelus moara]|uniref:tetraspanin-19 n=1 Tax=Epinephelus moara TaxID=300413 RepID=UPI00214EF112|nr:tetraspanin-19 [Epinephelus moara]
MKLEVEIMLLDYCFKLFIHMFLYLGLGLCGIGVIIVFFRVSLLNVLPSEELQIVGVGLLLIGGVALVVCIVGCVGAEKEKRVLLLVFMGFIIILVLGQLFVTLLLLLNRDKLEQTVDDTVDQIIVQYRGSNRDDRLMDKVQNYDECCGKMGPADWLKNSYIQSLNLTGPDVLPCSCFKSYSRSDDSPWCSELLNFTAPLFGRGNSSYVQGCKPKFSNWLQENIMTILGFDVSVMLIQVILIVITVCLYRDLGRNAALKKADKEPLDEPEDAVTYGEQNYGYIDGDGYTDPNHPAYQNEYSTYNEIYLEPAQGHQQTSN